MNKFWLEIERLSNKSEERTNKELGKLYDDALKELKLRTGAFMAEHQDLRFVDLLQLNKLESLYKQVEGASRTLIDGIKDVAYKADLKELELGYFGEFYNIESQIGDMGSNLSFGLMSDEYIKRVIEFPVDGIPLSDRLYGDTLPAMQKSIKATLTEGLIQGYDYRTLAKNLIYTMDSSFAKSKTIVRTEAGRVRSMARQEAQDKASDLGIGIKKKWIATLDKQTRHSHASMDGQIVNKDEEFTSLRGYKAMQPRMFGVAGEDINCRCGCTSVVDGIDQKLRRDNIDKKTGDFGTYEEWLEKKHPEDYKKFKATKDDILKTDTLKGKALTKKKYGFKEATTIQELNSNMKDVVKENGANDNHVQFAYMDKMNLDVAKEQTEHFVKLKEKYTTNTIYSVGSQRGGHTEEGKFLRIGNDTGGALFVNNKSTYITKEAYQKKVNANWRGRQGFDGTTLVDPENANINVFYHEFAHGFGIYKQRNVSNEAKSFWKEIMSIKKEYSNNNNPTMVISDYANSSVDEFLAESFTQAKLYKEPSPYAVRALEVIDRYYAKKQN